MQFRINSAEEILRSRGIQKGGRVQKFIDSEVLRHVDKYVPFRVGRLKDSPKIPSAPTLGSGIIKYNTPYAKSQYYGNQGFGTQGTAQNGLRGRLWFERMKAVYKDIILEAAARMAGGRRR